VTHWVKTTNPAKLKEAGKYISDHFKVKYAAEAVRKLLHKRGQKLIWPKVTPGDPPGGEELKERIGKYHEIKAAREPGTIILFGPACSRQGWYVSGT